MGRPLVRDEPGSVLPVRIKVRGTLLIAVENFDMAGAITEALLDMLTVKLDYVVTAKDLSITYDERPI